MTQSLASAGLTSALLNEGVSLARRLNANDKVVGTDSLALNQQDYIKKSIRAIGDALYEAADRIYNGEEIKSMAITEEMRNKISSDLFSKFIENLKLSAATDTDSTLHEILKNYEVLASEEETDESAALDQDSNLHKNLKNHKILTKE
jgi:hypothetical protein